MFLFSCQQMDEQDSRAAWNVRGGGWDCGSAGPGFSILTAASMHFPAPWVSASTRLGTAQEGAHLGDLVTGPNKHYQGWLQCREESWTFKNTFWILILTWLENSDHAENWRKTEPWCPKLPEARLAHPGAHQHLSPSAHLVLQSEQEKKELGKKRRKQEDRN